MKSLYHDLHLTAAARLTLGLLGLSRAVTRYQGGAYLRTRQTLTSSNHIIHIHIFSKMLTGRFLEKRVKFAEK